MSIEQKLKDLFETDPSDWASFGKTVTQSGNKYTQSGNKYEIFVSDKLGGFLDIVKAHQALEHVGLITNSRDPHVGDYGITTTDGHTTLGFGDGQGGFYDRVQLSDNAAALAKLGQGFSFEVDFGNRTEAEVTAALSKAAEFVAGNRDQAILKEAAHKRELASLAKRDSEYETIAAQLQAGAGRSDAQDERTVVNYIREQLQEKVPGAQIMVSAPEAAFAIEHVYGLKTQEREVRIILTGEDAKKFRDMSWDDTGRYMDVLSKAISANLPLTRSEFSKINGVEGGSVLTGRIAGSSAKLAAEISGELESALSTSLARPQGIYGEPEKPSSRPA